MKPRQVSFYKGKGGKWGAMQLSLSLPSFRHEDGRVDYTGELAESPGGRLNDGWSFRFGGIFLEITSTVGRDTYDWKNKITVFLNHSDISSILAGIEMGEEIKIFHDPNMKNSSRGTVTKQLSVNFPKGPTAGCFVNAYMKNGDDRTSHKVPLSADELNLLKNLLVRAQYRIFNW